MFQQAVLLKSLLKHCSYILAPIIIRIVNLNLDTGEFCPQLKHSITPLLKKPCLYKTSFKLQANSKLSIISKIIERIAKSSTTDQITRNQLFNPVQIDR